MITTTRWRIRFGTRTLFVFFTLCAWCAWQWSISEQQQSIIAGLDRNNYLVYDSMTVEELGVDPICYGLFVHGREPPPPRHSVLGAITGWDNLGELTVITSSIQVAGRPNDHDAVLDALSRLSRVTTLVIFDLGAETEKRLEAIEFKRRLHKIRPDVKVRHVHLKYEVP